MRVWPHWRGCAHLRAVRLHLAHGIVAHGEALQLGHVLCEDGHVVEPIDEIVVELEAAQLRQALEALDALDQVETELEHLPRMQPWHATVACNHGMKPCT